MPITDLFSKRRKRLRGEVADVYQYEVIPEALRIQIIHIFLATIGNADHYGTYGNRTVQEAYQWIVDALRREYGVFTLAKTNNARRLLLEELMTFFLEEENTERVVDVIELGCQAIDEFTRNHSYMGRWEADSVATEALAEVNARFKEHGVGYAYASGEIIRIDSELVHEEVVKPALRILSAKHFSGAQEEFLKAHAHYRVGNHKEALNEALKSLESTLKAICHRRKWVFPANATAKTLLDVCFAKDLIPEFWQSAMAGMRTLLESGVPTARNRLGGHGQGVTAVSVPEHIVSYVLHMTASAIVFLAQADEAMK